LPLGLVFKNLNMILDFAIATFCYGDRYYEQTNRLLKEFSKLSEIPQIFIVTDSPDSIDKYEFNSVKNISDYNQDYLSYNKNYYDFDFSVKRYSLLSAFESGHNKVILVDTDIIPSDRFDINSVLNTFESNTIGSQVTYSFSQQINSTSMLGRRFLIYEQNFDRYFDKTELDEMPEDLIQYISIDDDKKFKFIESWDKCIEIKNSQKLSNVPAGNIDEMCFSALYNGINLKNTSSKSINLLIAKHDTWYR